jgi:hypothetical protein
VELGFFETVSMIFLVVGHTKNVCDRRFNNLKRLYHKSQVFTLEQATAVLNTSKHVTVWPVDVENDWKNYEAFLTKPYKKLRNAKLAIAVNHIFTATTDAADGNKLKFFTRISNLEEHTEVHGDIQRATFATAAQRKELLTDMQPETIVYKGLPGYKQVLMHKNYIGFVPPQYHTDTLYKKPSKEVLEAEELDQKQRREYKKKHKKMKVVAKNRVINSTTMANIIPDSKSAPLVSLLTLPKRPIKLKQCFLLYQPVVASASVPFCYCRKCCLHILSARRTGRVLCVEN